MFFKNKSRFDNLETAFVVKILRSPNIISSR